MYEKREAVKAEIIEARSDWDRAKLAKRPASEIATLRQKVVALVGELQTLNGRRPANVEKPSTAVRLHALARLRARWREEAAQLENSMDGQYPTDSEMAERANALRECAAAFETEMAGTEPSEKAEPQAGLGGQS